VPALADFEPVMFMDSYQFTYSVYQRKFRQPLHTSHGIWVERVGIIIALVDRSGICHRGEIAPIPWFGSESVEEAIEYCDRIGDNITTDRIYQIPDRLPACQFGFGSALTAFSSPLPEIDSVLNISALLPTGALAIDAWQPLWTKGYATFKWKIGVAPVAEEMAIWAQLMTALPPMAKLRLDANGGLSYADAIRWLEICQSESRLEFIEQPLGVEAIDETIELSQSYSTAIGLDESVSTFDRLQRVYQQGWRGIYVIKPGIGGFPWRLAEFIDRHQLDVVLSSVLETNIGRDGAFRLAAELGLKRALGFGVSEWF
jgi:o-succinylbenzoate synthase